MILITGGIGAGKRAFACGALGFCDDDLTRDLSDAKPVVVDLQEFIRNQGKPLSVAQVDAACAKHVILCDDVGSGVVPIDGEERRWRDEVGRTCVLLAQRADAVVRMVCGVPQVIKGSITYEDAR